MRKLHTRLAFNSGRYWIAAEAFGYGIIISVHSGCITRPLHFETVTNYDNFGVWADRFVFCGPFNFAIRKRLLYRRFREGGLQCKR